MLDTVSNSVPSRGDALGMLVSGLSLVSEMKSKSNSSMAKPETKEKGRTRETQVLRKAEDLRAKS